ncbi:MAG: hypothetical protein QM817_01265 [Archangium sp.]
MTAPAVSGAFCGNHPTMAAVEICTRCGKFVCGDCVEYFREETPACANCIPHLMGTPASLRARISPILSTIGLGGLLAGFLIRGRAGLLVWLAGFLIGFAGLAFGVQELRLIRAGQAGTRGRRWAQLGLGVGALFALGFGILLVGFAYFLFRTYGRAP